MSILCLEHDTVTETNIRKPRKLEPHFVGPLVALTPSCRAMAILRVSSLIPGGYIFTWGGSARCPVPPGPLDQHQAARLETDFAPGSDISGSKIAAAAEFVSWLWQTEGPKKPDPTRLSPAGDTTFHHFFHGILIPLFEKAHFPPKNPQPVGTHMKDIWQWLMEDTFFFLLCLCLLVGICKPSRFWGRESKWYRCRHPDHYIWCSRLGWYIPILNWVQMTHAKKEETVMIGTRYPNAFFLFWNHWLSPWLMLAGRLNVPILTQWRLHNPASSPIAQGSWYVLCIHIYPPKEDLRCIYIYIYILRNALYNNIIHTRIYIYCSIYIYIVQYIYIYLCVCMCTNICTNRYMYKYMYRYMICVQHIYILYIYIIIYHISRLYSKIKHRLTNQASAGPAAWATAHAFWPAKRSPKAWDPNGMKPMDWSGAFDKKIHGFSVCYIMI